MKLMLSSDIKWLPWCDRDKVLLAEFITWSAEEPFTVYFH